MTSDAWKKFHEFMAENKHLLILVADPKSDEIAISFGGLNTFVKFPMESMDKGVVFNALRKSKFNEAIDAFMTGVVNATGISEKEPNGNELLKVVGGSMKALGIEQKGSKLEVINNKKNGKSKKSIK
jgi:hypothetical protein